MNPFFFFAPPSDTTVRYAEQSIDMAVLIRQLDRIRNHLQNPHARLAWAMDSTPAFGKDRQVTSVLYAGVTWGAVNQHDGLPDAEICTDLTILPVQVVLGKSPSAVRWRARALVHILSTTLSLSVARAVRPSESSCSSLAHHLSSCTPLLSSGSIPASMRWTISNNLLWRCGCTPFYMLHAHFAEPNVPSRDSFALESRL